MMRFQPSQNPYQIPESFRGGRTAASLPPAQGRMTRNKQKGISHPEPFQPLNTCPKYPISQAIRDTHRVQPHISMSTGSREWPARARLRERRRWRVLGGRAGPACLAPGEAAHETGPAEEPEETAEPHDGENGRGVQEELEEGGSPDRRRVLESYLSAKRLS